MQTRSGFTLMSLTVIIHCSKSKFIRLPELLVLFPSLKRLQVISGRGDQCIPSLLAALTLPPFPTQSAEDLSNRHDALLPNLETIDVKTGDEVDKVDSDAILGMIQSRFKPTKGAVQPSIHQDRESPAVANLNTIRMIFGSDLDATLIEQLRCLEGMGLKLSLNEARGFTLKCIN